jgi:hypothetical protein
MENRISKLKVDFSYITTIRNNVKTVFDILQLRINKLKLFYSDFIKNNKNKLFVFGLDSFHFQSKLIDIEYDDMKRLFLAINNRMYCEYFKLYKIISEYIYENINDKKIIEIIKVSNFPVYKDLEPFKEYNFEITTEVHENILIIVNSIISNLNTRENELNIHRSKQEIGLNIDNFITSYNYELIVIKEKILMFLTYIEFFHKLHTKHLKRFSNKIQLMYTHISTDIKFDESIEINKDKKIENTEDSTNEPEFAPNEIKLIIQEDNKETHNQSVLSILSVISNDEIITDDDSVEIVNDIIENNYDKNIKNNTPSSVISKSSQFSNHITDVQFTDKNVFDNLKNISQVCDNLLIKDNIDTNILTSDKKSVTETISDISDDVSVMSEILMDEPDNTNKNINVVEQTKPKRGRKKKN